MFKSLFYILLHTILCGIQNILIVMSDYIGHYIGPLIGVDQRLPLHYAAANGHSEVCEMLLRASSEQLLMKDVFGKSPLDGDRKINFVIKDF